MHPKTSDMDIKHVLLLTLFLAIALAAPANAAPGQPPSGPNEGSGGSSTNQTQSPDGQNSTQEPRQPQGASCQNGPYTNDQSPPGGASYDTNTGTVYFWVAPLSYQAGTGAGYSVQILCTIAPITGLLPLH